MGTPLNPQLEALALSILANCLTGIAAQVWRKGRNLFGNHDVRTVLARDQDIADTLSAAAASVARRLPTEGPDADRLKLFLVSSDVEAIVRQMYSMHLSSRQRRVDMESLRREFTEALALHLPTNRSIADEIAADLFKALTRAAARALEVAIQKGSVSAHEAQSAFRHRLIIDELLAIEKNLAFLQKPARATLDEINEFETVYRRQMHERHGFIIPPHFDAARKIPISDLYVTPDVIRHSMEKGEETTRLKDTDIADFRVRHSMEKGEEITRLKGADFLSQSYRAVLLGNPGGGKSTFAQKFCWDITHESEVRLLGFRRVTPILVVLREYGADKKTRQVSILQFIENTANARYQVKPPCGAFEHCFLNGRAVVIFDGLDELLETSWRAEIAADVESFCSLYPSVPVIVTSREVGYEQAPLDERRFEVFSLARFNREQVEEYARKWFAADTDLIPSERDVKAAAFLEESTIVSDLRSNPLMLALMCNIYRGENYIPKNRPDVYEKCSIMLFERWDKTRGIMVPLPFEAHIRPAMQYLAAWIYSDEKLQGGVSERELIGKTCEYLLSWRFEDEAEATRAAEEFIGFCKGRAWVFTDTGTRREGEALFQFTHRTFLEYFTAAHLVRTHPTPQALAAVLYPRIERQEWDVVAQVAVQLQSRNVEGAADELLEGLVREALEGSQAANVVNRVIFAARCLEFLVPRPQTVREVARVTVRTAISRAKSVPRSPRAATIVGRPMGSEALIGALTGSASENRSVIVDTLERILVEEANASSESDAVLAIEFMIDLPFITHSRGRAVKEEDRQLWSGVGKRMQDLVATRVAELRPKHFYLGQRDVYHGRMSIQDFVDAYGAEALFRLGEMRVVPGSFVPSVADLLLHQWGSGDSYEVLKQVGQLIGGEPPTLRFAKGQVETGFRGWYGFRAPDGENLNTMLMGATAFGAFYLLAVSEELNAGPGRGAQGGTIPDTFGGLRAAALVRSGDLEMEKLYPALVPHQLTETQVSIVVEWARSERNFVAEVQPRASKKRSRQ